MRSFTEFCTSCRCCVVVVVVFFLFWRVELFLYGWNGNYLSLATCFWVNVDREQKTMAKTWCSVKFDGYRCVSSHSQFNYLSFFMWNTLLGLACLLYWTQNTTFFVTFKEREKQKERPMRKKKQKCKGKIEKQNTRTPFIYTYFMLFYPEIFLAFALSYCSVSLFISLQSMCLVYIFIVPVQQFIHGQIE